MKIHLKRISKRSLALILGILMLFSTLMVGIITTEAAASETFTAGSVIYFTPGDNWSKAGAKFKATVHYSDGDGDINNVLYTENLKVVSGETGMYYFTLPSNTDYSGHMRCIVFHRMSPDGGEWANIKILANSRASDDQNHLTHTGWEDKDSTNTWSIYNPSGSSGGGETGNAHTVYFKNTVGWQNVYVYLYKKPYWDNSLGSGSNGIAVDAIKMSSVTGTTDVYYYEYTDNYMYISFTRDPQKSYNNFNNTQAVYRSDLQNAMNSSTPMYVPDTTASGTYNNGTVKYYNNGTWEQYPVSVNQYTVTYGDNITCSVTSGSQVDEGTNVTFTATERSGYRFVGFYDNSSFTGNALSSTSPYNVENISADTQVYAKYLPLLNIDGTTDNHGSIEFYSEYTNSIYSNKITQACEGDTVYVKVTANTGYKLNTLTAGTTDITTAQSFTMPNSAVTVTATFVEDYSTNWWLCGIWANPQYSGIEFTKTDSTSTIGYCEVELESNKDYYFYLNDGNKDQFNGGIITGDISGWDYGSVNGNPYTKITTKNAGTYLFTFDTSTKKLSVTYPTYTATIEAGTGGSVNYNSIKGATTVTATAGDGYVFDKWEVNNSSLVEVEDVSSSSTTITPLAEGGIVTAKFAKLSSVTVSGASFTSTPADLSAVKEGTAVKITLTEGAGYNFSINVTGLSSSDYKFENREITFTMPANNVTVDVSTTYDITVETPTNGTASVNPNPAAAGKTITVTTNPDDGYELDTISVTGGVTVTDNTFKMPAKPVTVTVTFKETLHTVTITNNVNSTTSTKQVGKITPVDISAEAITGYNFSTWEVVSGTATITDPTSADTSVIASTDATIKAVYTEDLTTNWIIHGNFTGKWESTALTKYTGTGTLAHVDIHLPANSTYYFGFKTGEYWYRYNTNDITATNCTDLQLTKKTGENQNCTIKTGSEGKYTFQFDTETKKLTVIYPTYTATIEADSNGDVSHTTIDKSTEVTATPDSGYLFDKWEVNDPDKVSVADPTSATTTITPLANGGVVTATFVKAYSVTVKGVTGYTSTPKNLSAIKADTAITINLPTQVGCNFSVSVTGVTDYTFANDVITFTMPANNVTVNVSVTYDITVETPTNGMASVDKNTAAAGDIITVATTPNDGYELDTITVTYGETTVTVNGDNTFEMPASPVTVTVTFKEKLYTVTIANSVDSQTSTVQAGKFTSVGIEAPTKPGYVFSHWTVNDNEATVADPTSANTTVTATKDTTITAVYTQVYTVNYDFTNKHVSSFTATYTLENSEKTLTVNGSDTTSLSGNFLVDKGTNVEFTVKMKDGYKPIPDDKSWSGATGGTISNNGLTYTFSPTGETTVNFYSYHQITITTSEKVNIGSSVTITINSGYDSSVDYKLFISKDSGSTFSEYSSECNNGVFTTSALAYGSYVFKVQQTIAGYSEDSNTVNVKAVLGNVVLVYTYKEYKSENGVPYDPYIDINENLNSESTTYTKNIVDADISNVKDNVATTYKTYAPSIKSNYFDYDMEQENDKNIHGELITDENGTFYRITGSELTPTPKIYNVSVYGSDTKNPSKFTSYYQQKTFLLDAKDYTGEALNGYMWYYLKADGSKEIVSTGRYYKLRVARDTVLYVGPIEKAADTPVTIINDPVYNQVNVNNVLKIQMNMLVENYLPEGAVRTRTGVAYCSYKGTQPTINSTDLIDLIHNSQSLAESKGGICEIGKLNNDTVPIKGYYTKQDNENGKFIFAPTAKLDSPNTYLVYSYLTYTMNNRSVTIVSEHPVTASIALYNDQKNQSTNS